MSLDKGVRRHNKGAGFLAFADGKDVGRGETGGFRASFRTLCDQESRSMTSLQNTIPVPCAALGM